MISLSNEAIMSDTEIANIWNVVVTIPGIDIPHFFLSEDQPTEEQIFRALKMKPRRPGDPNEPGIGQDERIGRLYPAVTRCRLIKVIDLEQELIQPVILDEEY